MEIKNPSRHIVVTQNDLDEIAHASRRLAEGDFKMSGHEHVAAAFVNGRLDLIDGDVRKALIFMGEDWMCAAMIVLRENWLKEMSLPPEHPDCPFGDQRIFTRPAGEMQ